MINESRCTILNFELMTAPLVSIATLPVSAANDSLNNCYLEMHFAGDNYSTGASVYSGIGGSSIEHQRPNLL